jgi:hypothetical protein
MTDHSGIGFSEEDELRPPQEAVLHIGKVPCYAPYIRFRELYPTTVERELGVPLPSFMPTPVTPPGAINKQMFSISRLQTYLNACARALRHMEKDEIHGFLGL